jgi:glyoxylase-like metal-dependent hydrolase (beta-lactamase superfamily II)
VARTLVPGVHLLGETHPNAAYAVETGEGLVLVDTCKEADAAPILRQLRALGLSVDRLRLVLLTHAHGDHALGARRLRELTGARVHAGAGDAEVLRRGGPREALFSVFAMPQETHPTPIDAPLEDGEEIRLGEARFRVIATPGHTPGSVCYLLERDGLRILFTGDTVMSLTDSAPLSGPGIYAAGLPPRFRGDAEAFEASLARLRALPTPDLVLPGHPRADPVPESPQVSRWWWRSLLARGIDRLRAVRARGAADGLDFLDGTPREVLPGIRYLGAPSGTAAYAVEGPSGDLYLVNAPGDGALAGLLGEGAGADAPRAPAAVLLTSTAPQATAGLRGVIEASGCAVYAPADGIETVRTIGPPGASVRPAASLPGDTALPVTVIPMAGGAAPSVAYALSWEGRSVLLSGEIPDPVTIEPESARMRWGGGEVTDPAAALRSLLPLDRLAPAVWLPLRPLPDQNAHLYDHDWRRVLLHTRTCLESMAR